jgi:transcriptional regulator with XRE-family HTH domain
MAEARTSRAALARGVGIDRSTVTQMLAADDVRMPGGHVVANMATALGVSCDWLLGLSDRPERISALIDTSLSISDAGRASGRRRSDLRLARGRRGLQDTPCARDPARRAEDRCVDGMGIPARQGEDPGQAIAAAHARLEWLRGSTSDYEIAVSLHEFESFVAGTGYYGGWIAIFGASSCAGSLEVYDALFPSLRLFLYDARRCFRHH